jgi:acetolactate synthase-1/2/3 large subunit
MAAQPKFGTWEQMNMDTPATRSCADAVVETLHGHGVDTIYALPGIQNDALFSALFDAGEAIRVVHTRHEQGAAYMALGAAMATGKPAVYSVVPGPGFLNTTAALCTAYAVNAPVFSLVGQIASGNIGRGVGLLHEIPDQLGILKSFTKWADCVMNPADGGRKVAQAFRALRSGRPRPVGLEIPPDVLAATGAFTAGPPLDVEPAPALDEAALERAVALLKRAERPMIFVGSGAQDAADAVRRLAERLEAPVTAYRTGRGVLDDRHPLSLTYPMAHRLWKQCDVVLAIGTRLEMPQTRWGTDDRLKIIRIDIDPSEPDRIAPPDVTLIGDAASVATRLETELAALPRRPSRTDELQALKARVAADMAGLEPQLGYLKAIRDVLPDDGILVEELTQMGYAARVAFPVHRPRTFLSNGYQGTLGWGYATALGAKDAKPDIPVVSICGDGGFMFNVQELATAVRHRIPLVAIVFNDGAFGNVRRIQTEVYGNRVIASDLTNPDFVRLADSFGVKGVRVERPEALRSALETAFGGREPVLIEVPCGAMPSPWPFITLPKVRG